jgi:hypothetical protein
MKVLSRKKIGILILTCTLLAHAMPSSAGIVDYLFSRNSAVAAACTIGAALYAYNKTSAQDRTKARHLFNTSLQKALPLAKMGLKTAALASAYVMAARYLEKLPGMPNDLGNESIKMLFVTAPLGFLVHKTLADAAKIMAKKPLEFFPIQPRLC